MPVSKKKKKKPVMQKKITVKLSAKQYNLLKLHTKYTGDTSGKIISKAIKIYLKQVSHEMEYSKKISSNHNFVNVEEKAKQMEIHF